MTGSLADAINSDVVSISISAGIFATIYDIDGIEIPFPQQVVWHRNQPSGPEA